jgi:hypothetical protein
LFASGLAKQANSGEWLVVSGRFVIQQLPTTIHQSPTSKI